MNTAAPCGVYFSCHRLGGGGEENGPAGEKATPAGLFFGPCMNTVGAAAADDGAGVGKAGYSAVDAPGSVVCPATSRAPRTIALEHKGYRRLGMKIW